jgi:hypothetical protein
VAHTPSPVRIGRSGTTFFVEPARPALSGVAGVGAATSAPAVTTTAISASVTVGDGRREQQPLRRLVRREGRPDGQPHRDQDREGQQPGPVQHRDEQDDRDAQPVGQQQRRAWPEPVASRPLGMPNTATPANSAPTTMPVRPGEPVATSTNHGSATAAISLPSVETRSATNSARNERRLSAPPAITRTPLMGSSQGRPRAGPPSLASPPEPRRPPARRHHRRTRPRSPSAAAAPELPRRAHHGRLRHRRRPGARPGPSVHCAWRHPFPRSHLPTGLRARGQDHRPHSVVLVRHRPLRAAARPAGGVSVPGPER